MSARRFAAGAYGYLPKASGPDEIGLAVREVLKGRFFLSPAVTGTLIGDMVKGIASSGKASPAAAAAGEEPLTQRETDIVGLVGQGMSNKAIAQRLGVSVTTVRSHLNRVYGKLGPTSRVELALFAATIGSEGRTV